jgi:autotransporter translocation and assembly factor TamB
MKKLFNIVSVLALALAATVIASAQTSPAAGEWDAAMNTPGGVRNFKLTFKVEGEKLTGTVGRDTGSLPLTGTAKGNDVQFSYTVNYNGNDLVLTMTGKITGNDIKGTVSFGGMAEDEWTAKRAGAASAAPAPVASSATNQVDVTGNWDGEVQTEQGSGNPAFTFKQEGEKLTGTYKGLLGESALTGTVKGDKIEFAFKVSGQVEGTVTYTGTTDGKTMKGKVSLAGLGEGTFTAKKK